MEHKLTRNPLGNGFTHIDLSVKPIPHLEKRFACIFSATRCIQCFTKALSNRDVETIKPPTGYLSKTMTNFDTSRLSERSLPMRSPDEADFRGVPFGLVHAQMIVSHPGSYCSPCTSFQGEGTCMPTGNIRSGVTVC